MTRRLWLPFLPVLLLSAHVVGCSSSPTGAPEDGGRADVPGIVIPITLPDGGTDAGHRTPVDAGHDAPAAMDAGHDAPVEADLPDAQPTLPQVITFGGPVLTTPKVQPIAFMDDTDLADMTAFLTELTTTTYWADTTSEYGVGPLTVLPVVYLAATSPTTFTDADITTALTANTTGASPAWGPADASTMYLFLFTHATTVSSGGNGCTAFDGYHDEANIGGVRVPYAVSCSCPGFDGPSITNTQERTVNISHELIESATDPFPNSNTAFGQEDDADIIWTLFSGGELADMCEFNDDTYVIPPGGTYMCQRSWSNAAAKAYKPPCVPHTQATPYFDAYARLAPETLTGAGSPVVTQALKIPVGQSMTVPITLWAAGPMPGPFDVEVYDGSYVTGGGTAQLKLVLSPGSAGTSCFSASACTGSAGDELNLEITVVSAGTSYAAESIFIDSIYPTPGAANVSDGITLVTVVN